MKAGYIDYVKYRSSQNERKKQYSYRAPVNIEPARDSALRTFYANTRYKKKKREKKRKKKGSVNDSARREIERASDFPRARPRAVDSASLFSLLSWLCTDSTPPLPGYFYVCPLSSRKAISPPGDLFQVIHTRFSPSPSTVSSPEASTCRERGEFVMHFIASNGCPTVRPRGEYPFPLNYFINRVFASKQQLPDAPLRSTALSLEIRGGRRLLSSTKRGDFSLPRLIDDESVSKTDRLLTAREQSGPVRAALSTQVSRVVIFIVKFKKNESARDKRRVRLICLTSHMRR